MPTNARSRRHSQAQVIRSSGERVTLLTAANQGIIASRVTPLDAIAASAPTSPSTDTEKPIYARVTYIPYEDVQYGEAGRTKKRKARIEMSLQYLDDLKRCYGVKLRDGSILRKDQEGLSEGREFCVMYATSYLDSDL